jgi:hypothetical protein
VTATPDGHKVRENDGVQLGFRFKFVVFCLGLFFLCFLCFRRSGPPALRVEKKKPKKSTRAPLYTRRWSRLYRLACLRGLLSLVQPKTGKRRTLCY